MSITEVFQKSETQKVTSKNIAKELVKRRKKRLVEEIRERRSKMKVNSDAVEREKELREEWLGELNNLMERSKVPAGDARFVEEIMQLGHDSYKNVLRDEQD